MQLENGIGQRASHTLVRPAELHLNGRRSSYGAEEQGAYKGTDPRIFLTVFFIVLVAEL